ncbi:Tim17/Tim22/Tim23/Pmp24 family-domain-containing protein [Zychaea mexicana]|uniref:Tim17/Tim22/Tim23/Pmp24 family-domain-containing protein n=1 Tax=Zychaea mexicana TaxID=64656 RepID=UPI0022FEB9EA|nr:Tim17/Tim22/Tim23/Pmp24 family-domain-containing protein [Zychaea mexicana]KAI9490161.1 Tim17/Tim22/Tim23/Pmp24 family-domain-containing protein [Zychaea mexicana]
MGIFGFGSSSKPEESSNVADYTSPEVSDDLYSPSGSQSPLDDYNTNNTNDFGGSNSYDSMPEFMSQVSYDAAKLQPMTVQGGIDFLQVEDQYGGSGGGAAIAGGAALTPSRGWTDDLCYGTGTTYLAGLTLGGAYGMMEGVRKSAQGSQAMKVRLNTTLNSITRRGPGLGNAVGVIAMMYNGTTAIIDRSRGTHDAFNSIAAGAISGALFKSTAGTRINELSWKGGFIRLI